MPTLPLSAEKSPEAYLEVDIISWHFLKFFGLSESGTGQRDPREAKDTSEGVHSTGVQ